MCSLVGVTLECGVSFAGLSSSCLRICAAFPLRGWGAFLASAFGGLGRGGLGSGSGYIGIG